jgi:lysosomal Pro-X carboxypeptidase
MVMPMCSDGVQDMFEAKVWNLSEIDQYCRRSWNVTTEPTWIVEQYGGKNIMSASNIIFRFDFGQFIVTLYLLRN